MQKNDVYRLAASMIVLKPSDKPGMYQLLLLKKPRKKDSWQVPQGGIEGDETVEQAAVRELFEEAGIRDSKIIGKSERVYSYDFPASFRRFRPDNVCGQRIEYIFAVVPQHQPVNVDGKEIDNYVWINPSELGRYIKRKEYLDLVKALYDEAVAKLAR